MPVTRGDLLTATAVEWSVELRKPLLIDHSVAPVAKFAGGAFAARKRLQTFLDQFPNLSRVFPVPLPCDRLSLKASLFRIATSFWI
jgi:hypothetical protein